MESLGLTEKAVMGKLKRAIDDGEIEVVGADRRRKYRLKDVQHNPVVGKNDVDFIPLYSAFLLVYAASDNGQIIKVRTLGSPAQVSAAGKKFIADNSVRDSARWEEALDRLITWGWIKEADHKGEIFELTGTGYQKADYLKEEMKINTENDPLEELKDFEG